MKKLLLSVIICITFIGSVNILSAQDNKSDCCKEKKECTQQEDKCTKDKKCGEKKKECNKDKKKKSCCKATTQTN